MAGGNGNAVCGDDLQRLGFAQPIAAVRQRPAGDLARLLGVSLEQLGHRGRGLHQHVLVPPIADQLHQRLDGRRRAVVQRDAAFGEQPARFFECALFEPDGGDGLALVGEPVGRGARRFQGVADGGRRVDGDDGVDAGVGEQRTQRVPIARSGRVGEQIDRIPTPPGRRQDRVERRERRIRELGELAPFPQHQVARHLADAAAVRQNRDAVAVDANAGAERAGGRHQIGETGHRQHAGSPERGVVDVGAARLPGGRRCRSADAVAAAGREHDHRLQPRRRARRR